MNQVHTESKTSAIKTLAIIGLIATVLIAIWILIQVVRVVPAVVSSLSSVAEDVGDESQSAAALTVVSEESVVDAGDTVTISWTDVATEGTYSFSYACTEGIQVTATTRDGENISVFCDESLTLDSDTTTLDLTVESRAQRFVDVPFTISFLGDTGASSSKSNKFTVVNTDISTSGNSVVDTTDDETTDDTATDTDTPTTPATPPEPETYTETYTYFPESNPNGFTDLQVRFLGIGELTSRDEFNPRATLDEDEMGAIRFEVRNIGTRTSESWEFEVDLPGNQTHESRRQDGLRPNEYATIVVGFSVRDERGTHDISVDTDTNRDTDRRNDSFETTVRVQ